MASIELAWRGGVGYSALIEHFKFEIQNNSDQSGRIEHNQIFTKTCQGGNHECEDSKWLTEN